MKAGDERVQRQRAACCVIGGLGFIGVNLTERLIAEGARVTIADAARASATPIRPPSSSAAARRVVEGDLRDRELLPALVDGQQHHLQPVGAVRRGAQHGRSVDGPRRQPARQPGPARVAARGNRRGRRWCSPDRACNTASRAACPSRKSDLTDPLCVHAHSQAHGRGVPASSTRACSDCDSRSRAVTNPYGPGQPKGRTAYGVINRLIHLALADDPLTIYGDGAQQRDYIHVDDVVVGADGDGRIVRSANGRAYNVGSGVGHHA